MSNNLESQIDNQRVHENTNPEIVNLLSLECHVSKLKSLKVGMAGILMIVICYYCTTIPELIPQIVGWFGIFFFGYSLLLVIIRSFRSDVQVAIDYAGITDYRTKLGTIRWQDVQKIWIGSVRKQKFLCIEVLDPEVYLSNLAPTQRNLAKVNESMGFPGITLSFSTLKPSLEEVVAFIKAKHTEKWSETA